MKKIEPENDANIHSLEWIKWKYTVQQYCVQEERRSAQELSLPCAAGILLITQNT